MADSETVRKALEGFRLQDGEEITQTRLDEGLVKFLTAVRNGKLDRVKKALATSPAYALEADGNGNTPLHFAVHSKSVELMRYLVEEGGARSTLERSNKDGHTALILAAKHDAVDCVRALLELGASASAKTERGGTAVHEAASNNNVALLALVLDAGAPLDEPAGQPPSVIGSALHAAVGSRAEAAVAYLLSRGANVHVADGNALTPLHLAAAVDSLTIVQALLTAGADVNARGANRVTALHMAAANGSEAVAAALAGAGAMLCREASLETPLDIALSAKATGLINILRVLPMGPDGDGPGVAPAVTAARVADVFKESGNRAFTHGDYAVAISLFSQALELDDSNAIFLSNRSAAYLMSGEPALAYADAERVLALRPEWTRGYFRAAIALVRLGRLDEAEAVVARGKQVDASSAEIKEADDLVRGARSKQPPVSA